MSYNGVRKLLHSARVHIKSPERTSEPLGLNQRQLLPSSYASATTASYDAKLQHRREVDETPTTGMFTPGVRSVTDPVPRQSQDRGSSPFAAAHATPHPPNSSSSAVPSARHRRSVQRTRGERDDETLNSEDHSINNQPAAVVEGSEVREDLEAKRKDFTQQCEETRASALTARRRLTTGSATPHLERNKLRFSAKAEVLNEKMRESLSRTASSVRLFDSTV